MTRERYVKANGEFWGVYETVTGGDNWLCEFESESHALEFAAAPDLLKALKEAHEWIGTLLNATPDEATDYITNNGSNVESDCADAIAKAEGR